MHTNRRRPPTIRWTHSTRRGLTLRWQTAG
jgi:hypothetical protein